MKTPSQFRILPVLILVAMLAFSVRLVDFASGISSLSGAALAEDVAPSPAETVPHAGDESDHDAAHEDSSAPNISSESDPVVWRDAGTEEFEASAVSREVVQDLSARRKQQEQRERELVTREALLRAAEQEVDRKIEELSDLRREIEALLQQQSEEERARINSLVQIYEGMKPKEAARIFDTLDLDVLISVMSGMSERKLSPIIAGMNPERARTITILLAQEKQLPSLSGQ